MDSKLVPDQLLKEVSTQIQSAVMAAARHLDEAIHSGKRPQVEVKADKTLVMNLDVESQQIMLKHLSGSFPIVAEEDPSSHGEITSAKSYFLVDPLDGTTSCKRFLGQRGGHIGYGPLAGFVYEGELVSAAFYSIPHRQLFTATRGAGTFVATFDDRWAPTQPPRRLLVPEHSSLKDAGMLFFISPLGEAGVVEFLRVHNAVENIYRFGGFASDCSRLAQGYEQVQLQFLVKPWDFPAVLLAAEAGCEVLCDPLDRRIPLEQWRLESNNPIVAIAGGCADELFALLDMMKGRSPNALSTT